MQNTLCISIFLHIAVFPSKKAVTIITIKTLIFISLLHSSEGIWPQVFTIAESCILISCITRTLSTGWCLIPHPPSPRLSSLLDTTVSMVWIFLLSLLRACADLKQKISLHILSSYITLERNSRNTVSLVVLVVQIIMTLQRQDHVMLEIKNDIRSLPRT